MLSFLCKLFQPKIGTDRWFKSATKKDVIAYRKTLQEIFMDPHQDKTLREQIHRYLPYLDKVISEKK